MNSLNQHFEEKVRPCIDLIDSLRFLGVQKDLALPAIAIIGDQSSGKSSVLEALSGVALPRGTGIVTRCPLELKMKRLREGEEWFAQITYNDYTKMIEDPADVEKMIREAQDEMAGIGVGICENLISLEIFSSTVPDLTLIDLPGITRVPVKEQPENISDQIKKLILDFITKQETIILVVVPCTMDIATTEALKMAQEVDPEGERTLGILTKPDLVDRGTETTVVEIVHNQVIHLRKGYMVVRCRGQQDINEKVSLAEAIANEKAYFTGHVYFNTLFDEGHATVPKLAEKLTLELVHHIQRSLPRLEKQIDDKLAQTQAELEKYGTGPPSEPSERLSFFIDKVTPFLQDSISLSKGEALKCGQSLNVFLMLRREFREWYAHLNNAGRKFIERMNSEVEDHEEKYRGRELPGFTNYQTFEVMVQDRIKQLEEPALKKLKDIGDAIKKVFIQLAQSSFSGFPHLLNTTKAKIEAIKQERESTAETMLRNQFKMELMVYTQDRIYINTYKACEEEAEPRVSKPKVREALRDSDDDDDDDDYNDLDEDGEDDPVACHVTLQQWKLPLRIYYKIASQRLADQIPLVIRYQMLQEFAVHLQKEMLLLLQDKDYTDFLLMEDLDIEQKRSTLQSCHNRLMKAKAYLMEF
uniref:interferon-induced GTP-binding protein Mx-like n=1 Tax=Doryrhamphus excisus TaxID=161450 RepID=UPI0025ADD814|nr:interferon-induced GTP-binding protein Mx-like [Doryrhamphus excisus]